MSKTQFRPKVEIEPYNSKLTTCYWYSWIWNAHPINILLSYKIIREKLWIAVKWCNWSQVIW